MEYRRLGGAGVLVSEIALGNWVTHGKQIADDAARACVYAAFDAGINFLDTADVYEWGKAETVLGSILKGRSRSDYVLATKCYFPVGPGPNDRGLSRKHIFESCNESLKRLRTDYIDLYQAHRFDERVSLEETVRAWDDLIHQGKVLYVGVSEWRADQIAEALRIADQLGLYRIVTNQPQYSMLHRVPEAEVIPLCRKEGLAQICWSPLAMGVLTGKYRPGEQPPADSRAAQGLPVSREFMTDRTLNAVQGLRPLAEQAGLSMPAFALAWVLQNDNVATAIIGATRAEQVTENVKAAGVRLERDLLDAVDDVLRAVIVREPREG